MFDFKYDGPGIAKGGTGVLKVDGKEVRTLTIPKTIPFLLPADETFDVGVDTRTGVNDLDYQVPFRFNGKIDKLTFNLGPTQLAAEEQKKAGEAAAKGETRDGTPALDGRRRLVRRCQHGSASFIDALSLNLRRSAT